MPTKSELMTANRYRRELMTLKAKVNALQQVAEYNEWKLRTDKTIAEINARIRATNNLEKK